MGLDFQPCIVKAFRLFGHVRDGISGNVCIAVIEYCDQIAVEVYTVQHEEGHDMLAPGVENIHISLIVIVAFQKGVEQSRSANAGTAVELIAKLGSRAHILGLEFISPHI